MKKTIIVVFERKLKNQYFDIEVPINITANELIYGLNKGLNLGLDLSDSTQCYLCTENPIALIKGNVELSELGLHDGTHICFNK